jgi:PPOX class probable F420-dependent enzyme
MDLKDIEHLAAQAGHLAVVTTSRDDGSIHASVVSAGLLAHPLTGRQVLGLVAIGGSVKLRNLRRVPRATAVFRSGWEWVALEGHASLIGPDDLFEGFDRTRLPQFLRDVFLAAGGTHDDWPTYDRVMAEERRTAVLIEPARIYGKRRA